MDTEKSDEIDVSFGELERFDAEGKLEDAVEVTLRSPTLADLERLAKRAPKLERLILVGMHMHPTLGQAGLDVIAKAPYALTHLVMSRQDLKGAKAGKAITSGRAFSKLEYLELSDNPLGDAFMNALLSAPPPRLRYLSLGTTKLGQPAFEALAKTTSLPALTTLNVSADNRREIGADIAKLGELGNLKSLRHLDVSGLLAGNDAVVRLLCSGGLPELDYLKIDGRITYETLVPQLPTAIPMPLRRLVIETWGTDVAVPWERVLWLGDVEIFAIRLGPIAAEAFFQRAHLGKMRHLSLWGSELLGAGTRALADAKLPKLRQLNIAHAKVFADVSAALLKAPWLGHLKQIALSADEIGAETAAGLATRTQVVSVLSSPALYFPTSSIQWLDGEHDRHAPQSERDTAPHAEAAPQAVADPETVTATVAAPVATTTNEQAELVPFASAKEACPTLFQSLVAARPEVSGAKAVVAGDRAIYDFGHAKLALLFKPATMSRLPQYQRYGMKVSLELFVRMPALERALYPGVSAKAYEKLPFAEKGAVRPIFSGTILAPSDNWAWDVRGVGGPTRLVAGAAERLDKLAATLVSFADLRRFAAWIVAHHNGLDGLDDVLGPVEGARTEDVYLSLGAPAGLAGAAALGLAGDRSGARRFLDQASQKRGGDELSSPLRPTVEALISSI